MLTMNNSTVTTKISAAFLATVLVAGIIALSSPSFMTGAQAQEYYGMDRDNKKSDKKDVSVKSVKCNNVNVNVNGLELNLSSVPFLSGLLTSEADEGERGAGSYGSNGYGNGGSYGDKSRSDGDFKFICINNNNNTVVGVDDGDDNGGVTPPPPVEPPTCDECFADLSAELQAAINNFLATQPDIVVGPIIIGAGVNTIGELCALLNGLPTPLALTEAEIEAFITGFLGTIPGGAPMGAQAELEALIECLIEAGVLVLVGVVGP